MILEAKKGLKEIEDKVKKDQKWDYKLLKGLHPNGVTVMQTNFSNFIDSLTSISSRHQNRVFEIQILGGCIHVAMEELQDKLNVIKDLAREHSRWLLRYTNVHVQRHEELILIIVSVKAYREKAKKGKKEKWFIFLPSHFNFVIFVIEKLTLFHLLVLRRWID